MVSGTWKFVVLFINSTFVWSSRICSWWETIVSGLAPRFSLILLWQPFVLRKSHFCWWIPTFFSELSRCSNIIFVKSSCLLVRILRGPVYSPQCMFILCSWCFHVSMYVSYVSMFIIFHFYRKGFRLFILRPEFPYNGLVAAPSGHLYLVPGKASHVGVIEIEQPSRRGNTGGWALGWVKVGEHNSKIAQATYLVGGDWNHGIWNDFPY